MHQDDFRHFGDYSPQPVQLNFDFMADDAGRDPHAPEELALRIVRGIFSESREYDPRTAPTHSNHHLKITAYREHIPPAGMPDRRAGGYTITPTAESMTIRQSMRPRVDMAAIRQQMVPPLPIMVRPNTDYSPARRMAIYLLLIGIYIQAIAYPMETREGWVIASHWLDSVRQIAKTIQDHGIKGTASYRPSPPKPAE